MTRTPTQDFQTRWKDAQDWRTHSEPYIKEVLSFCCPGREHEFDRQDSRTEHDTERWTSIGEECATDLAGDLITYYTPAESTWAEYVVLAEVEEDDADDVLSLVSERESKINDAIRASNYYDIAPQWAFEAASHGTAGLWVTRGHLTQPLFFEIVPPHELYLSPGHMGYLDRFRKAYVRADTLPALMVGWEVDLSADSIQRYITAKPAPLVEVVYGFWLDWSDPAVPVWRCEITVQGLRITPETPLTIGPIAGACPLLVGRFNPQPRKPWGRGPGWKALPDLRTLDLMNANTLSGLDQAVNNTLIYADDGFLDLSTGIVAGAAYAASRGFTRDQVYELGKNVNVDQGWFAGDRLEQVIRTAFYQDGPRQRGDTPPTASQWLDERRRVQQRIGKPSAPLWTELIGPMIQRVEYLMVEAGEIEQAITLNGSVLSILPISPLQKAQNQDQVMVSQSNMQTAFSVFGEATTQIIDPINTMRNIIRASGDKLTVIQENNQGAVPPPAAGQGAGPPVS